VLEVRRMRLLLLLVLRVVTVVMLVLLIRRLSPPLMLLLLLPFPLPTSTLTRSCSVQAPVPVLPCPLMSVEVGGADRVVDVVVRVLLVVRGRVAVTASPSSYGVTRVIRLRVRRLSLWWLIWLAEREGLRGRVEFRSGLDWE
jgi:hypothetical protein